MAKISVDYEGGYGSDLIHVNAARVSFGKRSTYTMDENGQAILSDSDKGLLRFLARGYTTKDYEYALDMLTGADRADIEKISWQFRDTPEHRSPFNHSFLSFTVHAPIYVARQLVKHEYLTWNEISGRYIEFNDDCFFDGEPWRTKPVDKKQGSGDTVDSKTALSANWERLKARKVSIDAYKAILALGISAEQARAVLPLDLMTQWRWSGTFGAFAKMLRMRLAPDAQKESRIVAELIAEHVKANFPHSYSYMVERNFE